MPSTLSTAGRDPGRCPPHPGALLREDVLPDLWLHMQQAHDLWQARRELMPALERIPLHGKAA